MNLQRIALVIFAVGTMSAASPSPTPKIWSSEWYVRPNSDLENPMTVAERRTEKVHGPQRLVTRPNMVTHFTNGGCMADEVIIYADGGHADLAEFFEDAKFVPKVKIVEREGAITELPEAFYTTIKNSTIELLDVTECSLTDETLERLTKTWVDAGKKPENLVSIIKIDSK